MTWRLLIGSIKNVKVIASSLVEVIVAMIIIMIGITGFFQFYSSYNKSKMVKETLIKEYVIKKELLDYKSSNNSGLVVGSDILLIDSKVSVELTTVNDKLLNVEIQQFIKNKLSTSRYYLYNVNDK